MAYRSQAATTRRYLQIASQFDDPLPEIDGNSPEVVTLKQHIRCVARDGVVTVLILGESGTGKERVARAIHRMSPRRRAPFVVVNCAGLSATLADDELFGHVRGAFTGAISDRPGLFERANGGTILLDEVGDLTLDLQMKLLRALQERTVQRLGSRDETAFDVRILAATNVDLFLAKSRGHFREDLYYRLKVYELRVPPLRSRGAGDLRALVDAILKRIGERRQGRVATLAPAVWDLFVRYSWPGNVRELENTLERMVVAAGDEHQLAPGQLPDDFGRVSSPSRSPLGDRGTPRILPSAQQMRAALERNGFKYGRTAMDLGLSRHQLYRLLKRSDVQPSDGLA